MERFRVQFSKEEAVKYISHLDLIRVWERSLRRAKMPVAFSEGFNPHPKLSLASALRVGTTSEAEILDIELSRPVPAAVFATAVQKVLPEGITIRAVKNISSSAPAAMAVANLAGYRIAAAMTTGCAEEAVQAALAAFLAATVVMTERMTSKGRKEINIRPLTPHLALLGLGENYLYLAADMTMGTAGTGRPEEIVRVLRDDYGLPLAAEGHMIHRTGLYHRRADGTRLSLLEI